MRSDLIVIGAGPAGAHAALAASKLGLSVVLVDEQLQAGGQVWRAPWEASVHDESQERKAGDQLRSALSSSNISLRYGRTVWSVGGNFRVDAIGADGNETFEAPRLVSAMGAYERVVPFPGWTLPGVIGLAASTVILKSHRVIPASPVVVAGCGPLLFAVSAGIIKAGGRVAAIADLASARDWLGTAPALALRPSMMTQGLQWAAQIAKARIPVFFQSTVLRAEGHEGLEKVIIGPVSRTGSPKPVSEACFHASCLIVGHGLVPGADIPRLLRAHIRFDRDLGGHVPVLDSCGRTSIAGLYATGDGSGIRGAETAVSHGKLVGLTAAQDAGRPLPSSWKSEVDQAHKKIAHVRSASIAMARLMALRPAQVDSIPSETIVCRCEDVTRDEIDKAIDCGARDINQLKHFTRCGMGPCQGRMCGDVIQELCALKLSIDRQAVGQWTARPPLRAVSLSDLIGTFEYDDIPIPNPAPL
ncbi:FAD-dependent oxidoreductase [Microvirga pudoricolor]|uniref:FAD-dependent oxidoreductase n=1 Tax=Microvirga pudoricolor TaxID=2778729 RepID=UPI00194F716C|nr:FAD-dependent oxidoreductase [Microvirga pudoricolor]